MTLPSWKQSYIVGVTRLLNLAAWATEGKKEDAIQGAQQGYFTPEIWIEGRIG